MAEDAAKAPVMMNLRRSIGVIDGESDLDGVAAETPAPLLTVRCIKGIDS